MISFEEDLKNELHIALEVYGYRLPFRERANDMLTDYLTIRKKLIYPHARQVFFNPAWIHNMMTHPKLPEIQYLHRAFLRGSDVNLFQNKRLFQSNFHDHLAYEWNIFHFHLSTEMDKKSKFHKQVKQLLFAYVDDTKAIFLGTDNHTDGTFGDVRWVEVLHDHFPETLVPYRAKGIKDVYPVINAKERQTLWDQGYTISMTKIRETVYYNPGVGRVGSGHSILVMKNVDGIMRWLWKVTEQIIQMHQSICSFLEIEPPLADFKLRLNETLQIVDIYSGKVVLSFPELINEELLKYQ